MLICTTGLTGIPDLRPVTVPMSAIVLPRHGQSFLLTFEGVEWVVWKTDKGNGDNCIAFLVVSRVEFGETRVAMRYYFDSQFSFTIVITVGFSNPNLLFIHPLSSCVI